MSKPPLRRQAFDRLLRRVSHIIESEEPCCAMPFYSSSQLGLINALHAMRRDARISANDIGLIEEMILLAHSIGSEQKRNNDA